MRQREASAQARAVKRLARGPALIGKGKGEGKGKEDLVIVEGSEESVEGMGKSKDKDEGDDEDGATMTALQGMPSPLAPAADSSLLAMSQAALSIILDQLNGARALQHIIEEEREFPLWWSATVVVLFLVRACFLKLSVGGGGAYETVHIGVPSHGNTNPTYILCAVFPSMLRKAA